jgi:hypothetical protein
MDAGQTPAESFLQPSNITESLWFTPVHGTGEDGKADRAETTDGSQPPLAATLSQTVLCEETRAARDLSSPETSSDSIACVHNQV